jgi:arylsulfatase A-like enzyme
MMKNTLVIFTSDHGGTGKGHGDGVMEHMEVPFILYGQGVKPGEIKDVVVHFDVAATIAWALGAPRPQAWRGVPVESAFQK